MERVFKYMMERVFKYMMFELVFHWKEAAQRSRIRVLSVGKNLQRGPGAAPLKWTPGPIVEFGGNYDERRFQIRYEKKETAPERSKS